LKVEEGRERVRVRGGAREGNKFKERERDWEGYNVREIMWDSHFESEKEKYWETVREGDIKREREQVRERNWDIDEEREGNGEEERGGKGRGSRKGVSKRERERERERGRGGRKGVR